MSAPSPVPSAFSYSVPEAARCLGVHENVLWTLIKAGELRVQRVGSQTRVRRAEVEQLCRECADAQRQTARVRFLGMTRR